MTTTHKLSATEDTIKLTVGLSIAPKMIAKEKIHNDVFNIDAKAAAQRGSELYYMYLNSLTKIMG